MLQAPTKKQLKKLYIDMNMTAAQVGKHLCRTESSIRTNLARHDIRKQPEKVIQVKSSIAAVTVMSSDVERTSQQYLQERL